MYRLSRFNENVDNLEYLYYNIRMKEDSYYIKNIIKKALEQEDFADAIHYSKNPDIQMKIWDAWDERSKQRAEQIKAEEQKKEKELVDKVMALFNKGMQSAEIVKELGLSKFRVNKIIKENSK